jgi:hypothetical protein
MSVRVDILVSQGSVQGIAGSSHEHGDEISGYIKHGEFTEKLINN